MKTEGDSNCEGFGHCLLVQGEAVGSFEQR
jgi:hypothetical protein